MPGWAKPSAPTARLAACRPHQEHSQLGGLQDAQAQAGQQLVGIFAGKGIQQQRQGEQGGGQDEEGVLQQPALRGRGGHVGRGGAASSWPRRAWHCAPAIHPASKQATEYRGSTASMQHTWENWVAANTPAVRAELPPSASRARLLAGSERQREPGGGAAAGAAAGPLGVGATSRSTSGGLLADMAGRCSCLAGRGVPRAAPPALAAGRQLAAASWARETHFTNAAGNC